MDFSKHWNEFLKYLDDINKTLWLFIFVICIMSFLYYWVIQFYNMTMIFVPKKHVHYYTNMKSIILRIKFELI